MGMALYNGTGPNFELCGKGSGKLCRYLRLGKPVILTRQGGFEWIAEYGAGEIAESAEDLVQAIRKISANYQIYSEKAMACYREHFSFEKYYPPIHTAIHEVVNGRSSRTAAR
jgi:glycosyltransferase involved in cell wall biosynthesis